MWTKAKLNAAFLVAMTAVTGGGLLAEQTSKPADSAEMAKTEAQLAKLRDLIKPQPGEYVTNIARIAWERDPWEAAVKAAKQGKPVIAYGLDNAGVTCGFG